MQVRLFFFFFFFRSVDNTPYIPSVELNEGVATNHIFRKQPCTACRSTESDIGGRIYLKYIHL